MYLICCRFARKYHQNLEEVESYAAPIYLEVCRKYKKVPKGKGDTFQGYLNFVLSRRLIGLIREDCGKNGEKKMVSLPDESDQGDFDMD